MKTEHEGHEGATKDTKGPRGFQEFRLPPQIEAVGRSTLDAALGVHRALGPGLLESAYEACFAHELELRGHKAPRQVALPIRYGQMQLDAGFRIDLLVDDCVIVEIKAIDALGAIHGAQLLTYLRMSGHRLGYLINFNTVMLRHGIRRIVH